MKRRMGWGVGLLLALGVILAGCTWFAPQSALNPMSADIGESKYLLEFSSIPPDVAAGVEAAGGTVLDVLEEIGVVVVAGNDAFVEAAGGLRGLRQIVPDRLFTLALPELVDLEPALGPQDEPFFGYQWNMLAIDAPGAWDAGYKGDGILVAIVDTGVDFTHPDLAPNADIADSASMVPGDPFPLVPANWHGTHVAGIVAADDNQFGVTGVAPDAKIMSVKVFTVDAAGDVVGYFSWALQGIVYAVENGADVINLSLGGYIAHSSIPANEANAFINFIKKIVDYAAKQGVFVVCSAGNDALDGQGDRGLLHAPSDIGKAVCISATGPVGWWADPTTDLDVPAIYTNYGPQIDFAAPGGNDVLYPEPDWHYDMVLSTIPGGWAWADGTSMAAPHAAGVAALILEANGGSGSLSHAGLLRELRHSADDLGKPGQDPYYGYGRLNAAQGVMP